MPAMIDQFHMWASFLVIFFAMAAYATERISIEITSLLVLVALLLLFSLIPYLDAEGTRLLDSGDILAGFGNPALITIMALLVMAQGLFQSGALERIIEQASRRATRRADIAIIVLLIGAMLSSAFLNNTPVVLMTIPILVAMAARANMKAGPYMMSLSFITILGGMLTLIGSSTNLLVADTAARLGMQPLQFFDQTLPGLVMMAVGSLYVLFFLPRVLGVRDDGEAKQDTDSGRQFIIELRLRQGDPLVGAEMAAGFLPALSGMTLQIVETGSQKLLPPFDDHTLKAGDTLFIAATRREIGDALALKEHPLRQHLLRQVPGAEDGDEDLMLAELVIAPGSRITGRAIGQTGFTHTTDCLIIGLQRRSRMLRHEMSDVRLVAGDVLLVMGQQSAIEGLRHNRDTLLLQWSARELPRFEKAGLARLIFIATVLAAVFNVVPIVVAALVGAVAMVMSGVLNVRQATRGFDLRIYVVVTAALAMAQAMLVTGGAGFVADHFLALFEGAAPAVILSAFFLLCAVITNILSNNATAVLFTPLAISLSTTLNVDPMAFILAVIFAANCSFATPIAYQTNLLVMTPGNFRFTDFMRAGIPLIVLLWLTYSLFAPWYFGL
jgi:di/tricarboxylate transporter